MRPISMLLALCLLFVAGCDGQTTPTPEDLIGDQVFLAKQSNDDDDDDDNKGKAHHNDHKGKAHNKGKAHHHRHNTCVLQTIDPLAAEMPATRLDEDFENEPLGSANALYRWLDAPGAQVTVTDEQASQGKKSLKVVVPGNVTAGFDAVGIKFCVRCEAQERFKASLSLRFENFVSWTGLAVSDSPKLAYWWWTRYDGSLFNNQTLATLQPKTWHRVEMDVDRKAGTAKLTIDDVAYVSPLVPTWNAQSEAVPMGCVRLINIAEAAQTFYVDKVKVDAIR